MCCILSRNDEQVGGRESLDDRGPAASGKERLAGLNHPIAVCGSRRRPYRAATHNDEGRARSPLEAEDGSFGEVQAAGGLTLRQGSGRREPDGQP